MQAGSAFSGGLASVTVTIGRDHLWGVINRAGREVVPLKSRFTLTLGEGFAAGGRLGEGSAIFDSNGGQLTPFQFGFKPGSSFNGGLVPATPAGSAATWGYINASGAWIIPQQFADASSFSGELARVTLKTGDFGYVNRRGKIVWSGGRMTPCIPF